MNTMTINLQMLLKLLEAMQRESAFNKRANAYDGSMPREKPNASGMMELLPLIMSMPGLFSGMMGARPGGMMGGGTGVMPSGMSSGPVAQPGGMMGDGGSGIRPV